MSLNDFRLGLDGALPVFLGTTYDEHVTAWRTMDAVVTRSQWVLAAIAASLDRSWGGSPRHEAARQATRIQRFCRDVGIGRNDFQRYSRTYRTFARTCTTGGTRFISELSFKHYEVAARLADDPAAAVIEAHDKGWSANELQRQLEARRDAPPFSVPAAKAKLREAIDRQIASWPEGAQAEAPAILQEIFQERADDIAASVLNLTPAEAHAIRWIKEDLESIPFSKRNFNEAGPGRGGDLEVSGGAAGAPIYRTIIGDVSNASRQRVLDATDNLLNGKLTPVGDLVLGVARDIADGKLPFRRLMCLPPDAGGDVSGTLFEVPVAPVLDDDDDLPDCLSELLTPDYGDPIGLREEEALAR